MNDQLQKSLADILGKVTAGAEAGVSFLQSQLPDVIHQLLMWKMLEAGMLFLLFCAPLFVCLALRCRVKAYDMTDEGAGIIAFWWAATAMAGCLIALAINTELFTIVQILVAPKIYLIEYAASLAK